MPSTDDNGRSVASTPPPLSAGVTLKAAEAMAGQQTFTRAQVAYIAAAAFWSGTRARSLADAAEIEASYLANFAPRPTREQRVALRIAEMERRHELVLMRWRNPVTPEPGQRYGVDGRTGEVVPVGEPYDPDCEWPEVAVPGGGA